MAVLFSIAHRITDSQLSLLGPGGIAKKIVLFWFSKPSGELFERMPATMVLWNGGPFPGGPVV